MRRIVVNVVPRAPRNLVEEIGESEYKVWTTAPPVQGKANRMVAELLSRHLGVAKSQVRLVAGQTTRHKLFEIE
ncbi:MAG: DUF167 domain-containing protein [bacterium]